jgi:hypothetical protein
MIEDKPTLLEILAVLVVGWLVLRDDYLPDDVRRQLNTEETNG